MVVVLNDSLEEQPLTEYFVERTVKGTNHSLENVARGKGYQALVDVSMQSRDARQGTGEFRTLGFVGMLSEAYSNHLPIAVAPHDFWFIANCELAAIVAKEQKAFSHIFTSSPDAKQTLMIPTNSHDRLPYDTLAGILEKKIPNKEVTDLMLPGLTTMDSAVFNAFCATLADTVQHYYNYMTFCCGIPRIKVRGEEQDYRKLAGNSRRLAEIFSFSEVALKYYDRIAGLLDRIADSFTSEDPAEFWLNIFSQRNVGSGGEVEINGWIRDFFTNRPSKLESYETAIASVPYKNLETGNEYLGLTGAFAAVRDAEGFWHSDFRETRFRKVDAKDAAPSHTSTSFIYGENAGTVKHYSDGSTVFIPEDTPEVKARRKQPLISWAIGGDGKIVDAERKPVDDLKVVTSKLKPVHQDSSRGFRVYEATLATVSKPKPVPLKSEVIDLSGDIDSALAYAMTALMIEEDNLKLTVQKSREHAAHRIISPDGLKLGVAVSEVDYSQKIDEKKGEK